MSNWPLFPGFAHTLTDLSLNAGKNFTFGSANTKTSWQQLVAAISFGCSGFLLHIQAEPTGAKDYLIDIGIGAAGSEVEIVSNYYLRWLGSTTVHNFCSIFIPVAIPKGVRVAVRAQVHNTSSAGLYVALQGVATDFVMPASGFKLVGLNMDTANSRPTDATCSDASGGAWAQIVSATDARIVALAPAVYHGTDTTRTANYSQLRVGVGGSGAEQEIASWLIYGSTTTCHGGHLPLLPCNVPAGSRLAAKVSNFFSSGDTYAVGIHAVAA